MFKSVSVIALLLAGVLMGLILSGRATDQPEAIARAPLRGAAVEHACAAPAGAGGGQRRPGLHARGRADRPRRHEYFVGPGGAPVRIAVRERSVLSVLLRRPADDLFGRSRAQQSLGSGVVISADGFVVTNQHVIGENEAEVTVTIGDRREVRAKIIGVDSWTDLALLKVEATGLPVIPWGDSSKLRVAEWVMAVGNPFSLNQTVTLGIVSALGRANVGITQYEDFIQTDAAINPGNSGGALINGRGELIGINTAIFSQSGGYQGIGFAVPSNLVRRVVDDLTKFGRVRRGSIGLIEVIPLTARLADELRAPRTDGIVVNQLHRESAAYKAGLEPGDIILSFNGTAVADPSQFVRMVSDSPIGSTARVEVLRDGSRQTIRIPIETQQERRVRRR